jgi:membrane carboxypeptidase/penicillin-binding protein
VALQLALKGHTTIYSKVKRALALASAQQEIFGLMLIAVQIEPEDGMDIITTLDVTLQDVAEKALRTAG